MSLRPDGPLSPFCLLVVIISVLAWNTSVTAAPSAQQNMAIKSQLSSPRQLQRIARQEAPTGKRGSDLSLEEFEENDDDASTAESGDKSDYLPATTSRPRAARTTVTSARTPKHKTATPRSVVASTRRESTEEEDSQDTSDASQYQHKQQTSGQRITNGGRTPSSGSTPAGSAKSRTSLANTATNKGNSAQSQKSDNAQEEEVASTNTAETKAEQKRKGAQGGGKQRGKSNKQCGVDYSLQVQKSATVLKSLFGVRIQTATTAQSSSQAGRGVPLTSAVQISVACMTLTIHGTVSQRIVNERASPSTCSTGTLDVEQSVASTSAGTLLASLWDNTESQDTISTCQGGDDAGLALLVDGLYISLQGVPAVAKVIDYSDQMLLANTAGSCKATSSRIPVYGLDIFTLAPPDGLTSAISFSVSTRKRHDCQDGAQSRSVLMILQSGPDDGSCDSSSFMSSESESSSEVSDQTSSSSENARENSSGVELANKDRTMNSLAQTQQASRKNKIAPASTSRVATATTSSSVAQNEEEEEAEEDNTQASTAKSPSGRVASSNQQTVKNGTSDRPTTVRSASSTNKASSSGKATSADEEEEEEEGADESSTAKTSHVTVGGPTKVTNSARSTSANKTSSSGQANSAAEEEDDEESNAGNKSSGDGAKVTSGRIVSLLNATSASLNGTSSSRPAALVNGTASTSISTNGISQNQSVSVPQGPQLPGTGGIDSYGGNPTDTAGYGAAPAASNNYGSPPASSYGNGDGQGGSAYAGGSANSASAGGYGEGGGYGASAGRGGGGLGLAGPIGFPGVLSPFGFGGLGLGLSWLTPYPLFWGGMNGYFGFAGANSY